MSSRSSNLRSQPDRQPRTSIFSTNIPSPVRTTKRGTTDHSQSSASALLDEYISRPPYRESLSVPQPRPDPSTGSSSTHQSHSPYQRSRRRHPQPSSYPAESPNAIEDNRFEKMLALLDVDDSISDSADRRLAVQGDGQGESRIPSTTRDSETRPHHPRTPSPSLPVVSRLTHPSRTPQQTTSFEQLRQIVSATSPNSKPRRRREDIQTTRIEGGADVSTGMISETHDDRFVSAHISETGSLDQIANPRYTAEETPRRRRRRMDDSRVHPGDNNSRLSVAPSPRRRNPHANEEVRHERPYPIHQRTQIPPEPYSPVRRRRDQQRANDRPESLAQSSSSADSQDCRSDFFDTAPPSDLDLRFPALSPQPRPLNSRRRSGSRQGKEEMVEAAEFQGSETGDVPADGHAGQTSAPTLAVNMPDIDVRWQSTKRLVDNYLNSHRHSASHSSSNILDREQSPEYNTARIARFRPTELAEPPAGQVEIVDASNRAVFGRLDAVTDEVRALRQQVAELHAVLNLVAGGRGAQMTPMRKAVQDRQVMDGSYLEAAESVDNIPSPVVDLLVHLDWIVRQHLQQEGGNDSPVDRSDPAMIAQICDSRNLDFLRTNITRWERELRQG